MRSAGTQRDSARPRLSVIIPVYNSAHLLPACLESLHASHYRDYEIILVDDASTDHTAELAATLPVRFLRLPCRSGPAVARNRGSALARGDYLLFMDGDVAVHPETLGRIVDTFVRDAGIDAVFGSYDTDPAAANLFSQYKNLFHHFVHQQSREEAWTFWTGCGAIRRAVFLGMGGFDGSCDRPCIEDIELGVRLHKAGHRIVLNKRIQVTHLKRWSLAGILKTDLWDRGVPWTQLLLREKIFPNDLNLKLSQRICTVLTYGMLSAAAFGAWCSAGLLWSLVLGVVAILLLDYASQKGWGRLDSVAAGAVIGLAAALGACSMPWSLVSLALLGGILLINARFYLFLARRRHPLFAMLVIPLHIAYYLCCGAAFLIGVTQYVVKAKLVARFGPCPFFRKPIQAQLVRGPLPVPTAVGEEGWPEHESGWPTEADPVTVGLASVGNERHGPTIREPGELAARFHLPILAE